MARFNPRHYGVVGVSGKMLLDFFRQGYVNDAGRCVKGLPADARVVAATYDANVNVVWLIVSSTEPFAHLQDATQFGLPLLEIQYTEKGTTPDV